MHTRREFRRVVFSRKLDVKRLQAVLLRAMRATENDPAADAAPARLESILIEPKATTVYLSGNDAGLAAVATALRSSVPGTRISTVNQSETKKTPRALLATKKKGK